MNELRHFFASRLVEIVVLGVCLQLMTAAFGAWSGNRPWLIISPALAAFLFLLAYLGIKELRARRQPPIVGEEIAFKLPRKAVIFTLGMRSHQPGSVVHLVVQQLKPTFVAFLGTPETDQLGIVTQLCQQLGLDPQQVKSESWESAEINEGKTKTSLVIDWLLKKGLSRSEIVVDLTGGTATMSVAAFMAAEERRVDCQYIFSTWDQAKNQPKAGTQRPVLITHFGAEE